MLWNGEYPLTPIFTPSTAKGVGQVYDWFPMRSSAQDALGRGVPPYPYFYPLVCEGSGASLGLVPDEVTVPGCFGTNRKVYKCLGHKPLSLHHGRLLDGPLSFRTTGHCKYRFWSCMTFFARPWRDLCRHGNPWDRSQSSVEAGGLFSNMADFRGRRHLEFLIRLLIGWNLWRPSWILKAIASIVLQTIAYCLSRLLIGYRSYKRPLLLLRPFEILSIHSWPHRVAPRAFFCLFSQPL